MVTSDHYSSLIVFHILLTWSEDKNRYHKFGLLYLPGYKWSTLVKAQLSFQIEKDWSKNGSGTDRIPRHVMEENCKEKTRAKGREKNSGSCKKRRNQR